MKTESMMIQMLRLRWLCSIKLITPQNAATLILTEHPNIVQQVIKELYDKRLT